MMVRSVERGRVLWHKFEKVLNSLLVHYPWQTQYARIMEVIEKKGNRSETLKGWLT